VDGGQDQRVDAILITGDRVIDGDVLASLTLLIQKLQAIHDATHPGAKLRPAAVRAGETKTEAERAALLEAFDVEAGDDG
jgi:hypothetical protein